MSYIESQLLPNERIVARTSRNKIVLILPTLLVLLFAAATVVSLVSHQAIGLVVVPLVIAVLIGGIAWLTYKSADFAVTIRGDYVTIDSETGIDIAAHAGAATEQGRSRECRPVALRQNAWIRNAPGKWDRRYEGSIFDRQSSGCIPHRGAGANQRDLRARSLSAGIDRITILAAAKICRFCNRDVSASPI